ncbi:MAG: recombinase family protein [Candidatus Dactylopiibacterium carminicum]|uniref:recombinase family protein n=1 Tax=Candidatus Dactylopiibacterium carminicum TaxID=857335 RepID=UPI000BD1BCCA|nr:recombinase family protein [Candidatus Dactylopiibacterium carminicum]PAS99488.1 MAG: recombinase family protein [Candidatus Dactylopiibacterium carminicum]
MQSNESSPSPSGSGPVYRAAQYVRMSTEHQQYSTENQGDKIREYAARRNIEIVRTYADEGKSGLRIDGRQALQQLIADVQSGKADFQIILVYDVSRWGRFQDADESAYYEYICRRAGIQVAYCAEQFENDGSPVSTIVKGVKRAMAGEYSRELSAKVFAGQCRLIELGFRQGGPAGYGLRRVLIDQSGSVKGQLSRGEHKSLQTDRVILQPGPDEEVTVVNQIYRWFVEGNLFESEIADRLNAKGIVTDLGRAWTRATVREILSNEKYIGNNVYNRRSFKLKKVRVVNQPEMWIKKEGAFEGIVRSDLFYTAQGILRARAHRYTNEELVEKLRRLFQQHGYLSGLIIDEAEGMPSAAAYAHRFGNLIRAYQAVGFTPDRDYQYLEVNQFLRRLHPEIVGQTEKMIAEVGGAVARDPATDLLTVNREFTVSLVLSRCQLQGNDRRRWKVRFDISLTPDITVAVRLDDSNQAALDYYLLPRLDFGQPRIHLADHNGLEFESYRFDSLDCLYSMAERSRIRRAA